MLNIAPEDFIVEELPLYEPACEGVHTFFAIRKVNLTTLEAINRIARELQVPPRNFGYAGLKDKNAITTQVLSVEGIPPEQVLKIGQPVIDVLWAERHRHKLRVGHLSGNRFRITVRAFDQTQLQTIKTVMEELVTKGVPNRFGIQRFGNRNNSHLIGKALMRADWETVMQYILTDGAIPNAVTRRIQRELACTSAANAVLCIPYRLRKLFLSAYQAYLFNCILAKRSPDLEKLSDGDLAIKHSNGAPFLVKSAKHEQHRADAFEISPSGPIFGYKMRLPAGDVLALESAALRDERIYREAFRKVVGIRLPGTRRALRIPMTLEDVSAADNTGICLSFILPAGSYATVVLEEVVSNLQFSGF